MTAKLKGKPKDLKEARSFLEATIRSCKPDDPAFSKASVEIIQDHLKILAGPTLASSRVIFTKSAGDDTIEKLKLDKTDGAVFNVQEYTSGNKVSQTAQGEGVKGQDGEPPDGNALIGNLNEKKGIYALEDVDIFNILCIPRTALLTGSNSLSSTEANSVLSVACKYCEKRRAFFIMDTPNNIDEFQEMKDWIKDNSMLRHKNSALYFPRVKVADPLNGFRLRSFGASGTIAGLYARVDSTRRVWKAPAGIEATLINVHALDSTLTDDQNGVLNSLGINCLRNFPICGNVSWGARTLDGSDQQSSNWKYITVRRMALFLEESFYRGTKWVVFEPNDEPLWAQIRLNIGSFMHSLFRQGAFQGTKPTDAYFVKCDSETTTQDDIKKGIVNILVGFAPLKRAEFVIIKIRQMAGKIREE